MQRRRMPAVVREFLQAAGTRRSYSPHNPYLWFGFAWGLPVPFFSLAIDCVARGMPITAANVVATIVERPHHVFFLLHPILFAWLFATLGAVRDEKSRQLQTLIGGLEKSLANTSSVNEDLRRAQGKRDEQLALVTHELKSPLATIIGYSELLLSNLGALEAKQHKAVEACLRSADSLNRMINDLLIASALDADLLHVTPELCDLAAVAENAIRGFAPKAKLADVSLEQKVPSHLRAIADPVRLEHGLANLISNALRHVAAGGHVTVTAAREDNDAVRVSVADDGCGIPADAIARLGERFSQANRDDARRRGGTGLGLYIVKGILRGHGTDLDVSSTLGKGTTMSFRLRAAPA